MQSRCCSEHIHTRSDLLGIGLLNGVGRAQQHGGIREAALIAVPDNAAARSCLIGGRPTNCFARLEAARASEAVGRAAADQARESRRIIRDRYESGLTDAAMLLRSADAVEQADAQQIAARVNVLTATATLQRAVGRP